MNRTRLLVLDVQSSAKYPIWKVETYTTNCRELGKRHHDHVRQTMGLETCSEDFYGPAMESMTAGDTGDGTGYFHCSVRRCSKVHH